MPIVTRTKIQRPQPIDVYRLTLLAGNSDLAQYPAATDLSTDPFYRVFLLGNMTLIKTDGASTQRFTIQARGSNTEVDLYRRFFAAADVTPTNRQGLEWQSSGNGLSTEVSGLNQLFPPGIAIAVETGFASAGSSFELDVLMYEALDPDEIRHLIT